MMTSSTLTLRIKRKYLEQIRTGEKTSEYRACNEYYEKMLAKKPQFLLLHYQNPLDKLRVKILSVEIIAITDEMRASKIFNTEKVFKINVETIRDIKKKTKHKTLLFS